MHVILTCCIQVIVWTHSGWLGIMEKSSNNSFYLLRLLGIINHASISRGACKDGKSWQMLNGFDCYSSHYLDCWPRLTSSMAFTGDGQVFYTILLSSSSFMDRVFWYFSWNCEASHVTGSLARLEYIYPIVPNCLLHSLSVVLIEARDVFHGRIPT